MMKTILLILIYITACNFPAKSQVLFGPTKAGGSENAGSIGQFNISGNELLVVKSLEQSTFFSPIYTNLLQAANGKLYGVTPNAGVHASGIIYSYDPSDSIYKKLYDFDSGNGGYPTGALMQAGDGKLYGMTSRGGSGNNGVIYSYDPFINIYTKLYDFDNITGSSPYGSLTQSPDGKLYGMTKTGGSSDQGVIFSFDPLNAVYKKLVDLSNANGGHPFGSLLPAANGRFYGMTSAGGSNGVGVLFSFDPANNNYSKLKDLEFVNGANPYGNLIESTDGKLYGMTVAGGSDTYGVLFSFDLAGSVYTKLKDLTLEEGAGGNGSLLQAADGKLYGLTNYGGTLGNGTIFSFDPTDSVYTSLKNFELADGGGAVGSLIQATNGKLYGVTNGQAVTTGVIFSYDPPDSAYRREKDFLTNETGINPSGSMVRAKDGKLYGVTSGGGNDSAGIIFSFDPLSNVYSKRLDFDNINGGQPLGRLLAAGNGKLYGMTSQGGTNGFGVLFSFETERAVYTVLKHFDNQDGSNPAGGLIQAKDGKLYGMTFGGGTQGFGTIFSFDPGTGIFTKLKDFDDTRGSRPYGCLLEAADGKLYGMTYDGGYSGLGVLFSLDPVSAAYRVFLDFDGTIASRAYGSLIQATDGKLYGMSYRGGDSSLGRIFSFDPVSSAYAGLMDLYTAVGCNPAGDLVQASDGKLYGMTSSGGTNNLGVIFSFDPANFVYTKLKDYDGANGASPFIGAAFTETASCNAPVTFYRDADGDGYGNADSIKTSCLQPSGYTTNNRDCNDNDATVSAGRVYYNDADGDGLGDRAVSINVCDRMVPVGYVKNNYDCDDRHKAKKAWNERVLMCHLGIQDCIKILDVWKMIRQGWTLGTCQATSAALGATVITGEWLNKFDSEPGRQKEYKLSNYPNPFSTASTILYEIPVDSRVSIKVYDLLGRTVATLVDGYKQAGSYTVNFNAAQVNTGSLYYRIVAQSANGQFQQTNKMIRIR